MKKRKLVKCLKVEEPLKNVPLWKKKISNIKGPVKGVEYL